MSHQIPNSYNFYIMADQPEMNAQVPPEAPSAPAPQPVNALEPGMKAMPVMVYTAQILAWGDIHIYESLRVSVILQSSTVPDYISLYSAKQINLDSGADSTPVSFPELHIPTPIIIAFHLMPSHTEPLDYDENEPNRKMEPILAQVGKFKFNAYARMSSQTNIKSYVEVARSEFISLYDLEIFQSNKPNQQPMKVVTAQVRRTTAIFSVRS